jgi:arylsulfatase A-like enzyme
MTGRQILKFFIMLVVAALSFAGLHGQQPTSKAAGTSGNVQRLNILWIVADDLGADLGCYGDPLVHSPHLNRLATEGTLYSNLYTVTAVCSPSRSALITGMYPVSINCHQHRTQYKNPLPAPVKPITEYFREAGYFVTNGNFRDLNKPGKTDYNFIHHHDSLYDGSDWRQRKNDQPFFSQVQIFYPHRPFARDPSHPINPDAVRLPPYYPDHRLARQDWALYLETVQIVDQEVGRILERLEEDGLANNTVVFFFGDQGRPHVRDKQFLYDGGTHTPLIVRWPGKLKPGTKDSRLISNVDLGPAAMQVAGIVVPEHMQGKDFLAAQDEQREHVFSMRDRRDETVDRIRSVRTQEYKYIRNYYPERPYTQFNAYKKQSYPVLTLMQVMHSNGELTPAQEHFMQDRRPAEELYDLRNDPHEIHNLALDADYQWKKKELSAVLNDWLAEADKGQYPEDPAEIAYARELMRENYRMGMERIGLSEASSDEEILTYWEKVLTPTKTNDE